MYIFHLRCWSTYTPRNFVDTILGIMTLSILISFVVDEICLFVDRNIMSLVSLRFNDNLLALNQSLAIFNSVFANSISFSRLAPDRNMLESSAKRAASA